MSRTDVTKLQPTRERHHVLYQLLNTSLTIYNQYTIIDPK